MDALIRHDLEELLSDHRVRPSHERDRDVLIRALETFIEERFVQPARQRMLDEMVSSDDPPRAGHDGEAKRIAERTMQRLADQTRERNSRNGQAGAAVRAATTGKRARKTKRWAGRAGVLALVLLAACGSAADDVIADDALDADAGADGGTDVDAGPDDADPDAGPGLALGSACDPTISECAGGLSCRVVGFNPTLGRCELAGPLGVGEHCNLNNGDGDCGAAMACLGDPPTAACYLICDRADPAPRCGAGGSCVPVWGDAVEIGACAP